MGSSSRERYNKFNGIILGIITHARCAVSKLKEKLRKCVINGMILGLTLTFYSFFLLFFSSFFYLFTIPVTETGDVSLK
jgi:uncharacterized membrane protein YqjE